MGAATQLLPSPLTVATQEGWPQAARTSDMFKTSQKSELLCEIFQFLSVHSMLSSSLSFKNEKVSTCLIQSTDVQFLISGMDSEGKACLSISTHIYDHIHVLYLRDLCPRVFISICVNTYIQGMEIQCPNTGKTFC